MGGWYGWVVWVGHYPHLLDGLGLVKVTKIRRIENEAQIIAFMLFFGAVIWT